MLNFYTRYQRGLHKEVYNELVALQEQMYDRGIYEEALFVMRALMTKVRYNIELLVSRLHAMNYQFGEGFWEAFADISPEEKAVIENDIPIYRSPTSTTVEQVRILEELIGPLPLSLKCWYEEVGSVNFIGAFPRREGYGLDPLFI